MKPTTSLYLLLLISLCGYNCRAPSNVNKVLSNTTGVSTKENRVDALFTGWTSSTPGAAIAVIKDGSIIYKKGYGVANLEYDIPATPVTVFHIASVSKQFTVFSVLLLEKDGKLSLDDDIRKYIQEVPDFGKKITLRHLASHTSGLRDQWNLLALAGWRLDDVITKEHVLKLVSKQKELNFNPGEEFLYCNTGFTLLAEVVARVSGQTFSAFTDENIFRPLGMSNTLFYDDHERIVKNRAYSYHKEGDRYKKSVLSYANVGATSLFTTAEDLALWALNFSSPKIGDPEIIGKMNTLAVLNNGKTFGGALGQFVGDYKGMKEIQHGGADAGYRSFLTRFPDKNFAVVVLSNDASFNPNDIAHKIVDIYLDVKPEVEKKEEPGPEERKKISIDQKTLESYMGEYQLFPAFTITITQENGQLFGQGTGQPKVSLNPISATEFVIAGVEAKIIFEAENNGKAQSLKLHQAGQIMEATRVKPFDQSSVQLSEFTGRFYSEELSTSYDFTVVGGKLIARHNRVSDIDLTPVKEDTFRGNTWFFGKVDFVRDRNMAITGCRVSSGRVRNVFF
ncbi:MAG TPA: serine hydrolase, partial [Chryseosolibacter sp.]|nr:serine hydrolase [Chryseosolibacter sp.]